VRAREAVWPAAALGIHVLVFVLAPSRPAADDGHAAGQRADDVALEIATEIAEVPSAPPPPPGEAAPSPRDRATVALLEAARARAAADAPEPGEGEPAEAPAAATGIPGLEPAPPHGLEGLSNDALGLGTRNALLAGMLDAGAGGAELARREGGDNVAPGIEASLHDALRDGDVAAGYGAGGPLIGPAEDAARASDTPWNSSATFEVSADASGVITAVHLVDASQAWGPWEKVAARLLGAMRERKLRVPSRGKGVVVTLQVTSHSALPSGAPARYDGNVADPSELRRIAKDLVPSRPASAPAPSATTADRAQHVDMLKPAPRVEDATPQADNAVNLRIPKDRASGVDVLRIPFDMSDIGQRPARSVHARVLRERTL
jgi:hypothetical protein